MLSDKSAVLLSAAHLGADIQTVRASIKNLAEFAMLVPEGEGIDMNNLACSLTLHAEQLERCAQKLEALTEKVGPACVD